MDKTAKTFFDGYATGFDAIYGTRHSFFENVINKLFRKSMRMRLNKVMDNCFPIESKSILDVGCGPGLYCVTLAKHGASRVVGVDFADEMIAVARNKAAEFEVEENCVFHVMDAMKYSSENKFDYTIVMGVMDYIEDAEAFIKHLLPLTQDKIMLSFPVDDGLMAAQRKYRYKKRCPLYMYKESTLQALLNSVAKGRFRIERIARDFFVTIFV